MAFNAIVTLFLSLVSIIIFTITNLNVPNPYMDEFFHYTQTHSFHIGDFRWNPKITTPPGLYLPFLILPHLNLAICRGFNTILGLASSLVMEKLLVTDSSNDGWALVFFPPSFFFHFLFYTDTCSTLLVMASLLLARQRQYVLAGLIGTISLSIRQTNAVWMAFIAGTSLLDILNDPVLLLPLDDPSITLFKIIYTLIELIKQCIYKIRTVIARLWSFILLLILFAIFVFCNGSITLGDKANHQASLHIPQLFYFSAFTCFFALFTFGPIRLITSLIPSLLSKNWQKLAILTPLIYYIVQNYTIAHPFLLADNRHFTFYIWRYILRYNYLRAALSPAYGICFFMLFATLRHKPLIWIMIYLLAICLTLIPSPLIEFRYFIIPYYIWRLNMRVPSSSVTTDGVQRCSFGETAWYCAINVVAFTLFLAYPFEWSSEPGVMQRFMW